VLISFSSLVAVLRRATDHTRGKRDRIRRVLGQTEQSK
jgi:hypothetical protein